MTGISCRRCGETAGDMTRLWKPEANGELIPYAAQCRPRCGTPPAQRRPQKPARPAGPAVVTAFRPGKCTACTWDIVPGDKIMNLPDRGPVHLECAPADPPAGTADGPGRRRERYRQAAS